MEKETLKKIESLAAAADWHLKKMDKAIEEFNEGKNILKEIINLLEDAKKSEYSEFDKKLDEFKEEVKFIVSNPNPEQRVFEYLKEKLHSEEWPLAVAYDEICETETEKEIRASNILDLFNINLEGKKFLDFGCGEGYVAKEAIKQNCILSVGYDINNNFKLKTNDKLKYSSSEEEIKSLAPFDFILIYDVLDHTEKPIDVLNLIKSLTNDETFIFLRCHPWCSRHSGHYHKTINRAYLNIIFDKKELIELDINPSNELKITDPEREYDNYIDAVGLKIIHKKIQTKEAENFFKKSVIIQNKIKDNFEKINRKYIPYKTNIEYVDFVLSNKVVNL